MSDKPQVLLAHHLKALKLPTFLREYDRHRQLGGSPACEMRLSQVGGRDDNVRCSQLRRLPLPG